MPRRSATRQPRQLYRDEWLQPLRRARPPPARRRRRRAASPRACRGRRTRRAASSPRPPRPAPPRGPSAPAASTAPPPARSSSAMRYFPEAIADHVEALAALAHPRPRRRARSATAWSTAPSPAPRLIATASPPYWQATDTAAAWRDVSKGGDIGFSFTRSDGDPERCPARSGLGDRGAGGDGRDRSGARARPPSGLNAGDDRRSRNSSGCTRRVKRSRNGWRHLAGTD